jgi:predicted amidohydrolase
VKQVIADLRLTMVQTDIIWENPVANRNHLTSLVEPLRGTTDLIVLPEMFTTGFTLNGQNLAESMDGDTVEWMAQCSADLGAVLAGSIIVREKTSLYNRLLWVSPEGSILSYDKRHLFRYARENDIYSAGTEKKIFEVNGWKVRPFICYDLRFPSWSANVNKEYDLGFYVANWPKARVQHWNALLVARAIENQAYIAGVNRVGRDGNDLRYSGNTALFDPQGGAIRQCGAGPEIVTSILSYEALEEYRTRFPAWMDM